ncbi:shikimate kinase [Ignisphaera aggregans DSM 17230]|uniref:Shikimate kinase n=1 Tax=Ignisphaera aggregans (strain DSM 17230 / JCM 13409 / AQ1.S1) TaxID=583356 RepID=E0SS76_IGNAA|nr:shikimate kinase [Ignisphaera aggregans DSM 17230]
MYAYGGVTIVNAVPAWLGSAMAIDLRVRVYVDICRPTEICYYQSKLVEYIVKYFMKKYNIPRIKVYISSEIPPSSGLKSSSAVSVALIRCITSRFSIYEPSIPRLAAELSRLAGVSFTGALDDASASYYGGIVFTDNLNMNILKVLDLPKEYTTVLLFHATRNPVDVDRLRRCAYMFRDIFELAYQGEIFRAMTMNGLLIARLLGYNEDIPRKALEKGALAAGVSGNGPTIFAITRRGDEGPIYEYFSLYGYTKVVDVIGVGMYENSY